uniref:Heat shock protein binding protein, putative n=1 Tax=Arundo donax TaxID=35708 RepID=A0A0A9ECC0_ARUDO
MIDAQLLSLLDEKFRVAKPLIINPSDLSEVRFCSTNVYIWWMKWVEAFF